VSELDDPPGTPGRVQCAACGRQVEDDEAQAQRWGYWSDSAGEVYPYCPECAQRLDARRGTIG
jgi:NAD-dependent SIR2 family protein deacetylase